MELLERRTSRGERAQQPRVVTVGCDLGQRRDPTAICVTEPQLRATGRKVVTATHEDGSITQAPEVAPFYAVRFLERQELGTSYPAVASRLAGIVGKLDRDFPTARLNLVMDSTGVGLPVVEMVRDALRGSRCRVTGAVLTGSERMEGHVGGRELRLGKLHLVSTLQALLQQGRIGLPRTSEAGRLAEELLDFELRVNENANLISGAFRTGAHDDLVIALGLSVLQQTGPSEVGYGPVVWD